MALTTCSRVRVCRCKHSSEDSEWRLLSSLELGRYDTTRFMIGIENQKYSRSTYDERVGIECVGWCKACLWLGEV